MSGPLHKFYMRSHEGELHGSLFCGIDVTIVLAAVVRMPSPKRRTWDTTISSTRSTFERTTPMHDDGHPSRRCLV